MRMKNGSRNLPPHAPGAYIQGCSVSRLTRFTQPPPHSEAGSHSREIESQPVNRSGDYGAVPLKRQPAACGDGMD